MAQYFLFAGMVFGGLGFVLLGWAPLGCIIFAAIPVNAFWGLAAPPSQSMMTLRVSASKQGELQGALSSMWGLAMIIGPGMFSATFAWCIGQGPAFAAGPWCLAAFILLIALGIAVRVTGGAEVSGELGQETATS